jgi:putative membrane protein
MATTTTGPERRLHPASFLFSMGGHVRSLLIPGAAVIFTAGSSGRDWEVWLMLLLIPYAVAAIVRSLSFRYRFDPAEMVVRRGWIFRNERHIPYGRIQNIDAVQNVFHRALGVAEVRVETASGGEPEATMTVLPVDALAEMRRFVFAGRAHHPAAAAAVDAPAAPAADTLLQLRTRDVLLYGLIESRGAVLMAGGLGLLYELGLFNRFVESATGEPLAQRSVIRQIVRAVIGQGPASAATIAWGAGAFVALLLLLRVLSMAWAYIRLHGFVLSRAGEDVRVDYGLLTRVSSTIPLQRIQTVTISEGPLHRLFDRVSVHVDTAGGDAGEAQMKQRREPIAPVIRRGELGALLAALIPSVSLTGIEWQTAHPRAVRRMFIRGGVATLVLSSLLFFALREWTLAVAAALGVWSWFYGGRFIAWLGWALAGDAVVFRSGWLWRNTTVARFSKIQVVTRHESPFDRRTGMATVKVDTAATATHEVDIPFVPAAAATSLAATLAAQANEAAFRW